MHDVNQLLDFFQNAFDDMNKALFENRLPACAILAHRKRGAAGYFWAEQWTDGEQTAHEIALNPDTFRTRDVREILSTLAHEMCHLEQQAFGKPSRSGYHNKEWARMMENIGLAPFALDNPDKQTGQRVTHLIADGGPFDQWFKSYPVNADLWGTSPQVKAAKKRKASKVKYTCGNCGQNAWAKPDAALMCGDCRAPME